MRHLRWLSLLLTVAGCNGSGIHNNGMDASVGDLAMTDQAIVPGADMAAPPTTLNGTLLQAGILTALGVTSDDFVAVLDGNNVLSAIPVAGGAANLVETSDVARIRGKYIFSWHAVDMVTSAGGLSLWSKAGGLVALGTTSPSGSAAVSTDGNYVMYQDGVSADGTLADVYVAKSDGTMKTKVLSQVQTTQGGCAPQMGPVGALLVTSSCPTAGDAGTVPAQVATVDPTATTPTANVIMTGLANFWSASKNGTQLLLFDSTNKAMVAPLPFVSGTSLIINLDTMVNDAILNPTGSAAIYITAANDLKSGTVAMPPVATTLITGNVTGFLSTSPDWKYVLFYNTSDTMTGLNDIYLASTTTPGAPVALEAMSNAASGGAYGNSFTADSTRALFIDQVDADFTGILTVKPVSGGTATQFSSRVWSAWATNGTNVVFNDRYMLLKNRGYADIKSADAAGSGATTLIVTQADQDIFLSSAHTKVLFTVRNQTGKEGLYAATVP